MKIFTLLFVIALFFQNAVAQVGGRGVYNFLSLTNASRQAALGGKNVTLLSDDPALAFQNPALLNDSMDNHFVLNYVNYFGDINFGYVGYAKTIKEKGIVSCGLHYINYGDFTRTDETGADLGSFKAAEYALNIIAAKKLDSSFTIGVNLKPVYSKLESYQSFGLVADAGVNYNSVKRRISVSLVLRNAGIQIVPYYKGNHEPIEPDIIMGFTKKLKHAPLRLSVTAHHLNRWDMTYTNPEKAKDNTDLLTGEVDEKSAFQKKSDLIMRHIIIGGELLVSKNFYIGLGYNYQRRMELKIDSRPFTVGISWGFGFRISKFHFAYARANYHLTGPSNHFSISTNLSSFIRKVN